MYSGWFFGKKIFDHNSSMKKLIIFFLFAQTLNANAAQYFWKCYDHMLMSSITNKVESVERKKFKSGNIYVDTNEKTLKYWSTSKDLLKELANNNPIKHDFFIKNILINDEMIITANRPFKEYPDEYNIFTMDLKNKKLIRVVSVANGNYTKHYDCDEIPLK